MTGDLMRGMDGLTLGERIRRIRRQLKRRQTAIASSTEVSVYQWSRWENDQVMPNLYHFAAIADMLCISMDFLYWGYENDRATTGGVHPGRAGVDSARDDPQSSVAVAVPDVRRAASGRGSRT